MSRINKKINFFSFQYFWQLQILQQRKLPQRSSATERFYLGQQFPKVYLTLQEARCMYCFLNGMTDEQTAKTINLSTSTVSFYLLNMRKKLACRSKKELIAKIRNSDFVPKKI